MQVVKRTSQLTAALVLIGFLGYVYFFPGQAANSVKDLLEWLQDAGGNAFRRLARFFKAMAN